MPFKFWTSKAAFFCACKNCCLIVSQVPGYVAKKTLRTPKAKLFLKKQITC